MNSRLRMLFAGVALIPAGAAHAADALKFGPAPNWVVEQAIPNPAATAAPVAVLLNDQQTRFIDGKIVNFTETAFRIQNPQGLAAGSISIGWQPETDTVTVHKLQVRRGDKVIDVLAGGQTFTTLRRETNLEAATLDGTLTANIQPEGLQVGDVIVFAASNEHLDPVLKGHVETLSVGWNGQPIEKAHTSISWPSAIGLATRQSSGLPAPRRSDQGGVSTLDFSAQHVEPMLLPDDAPVRFKIGRVIEASDYQSWSGVADLFRPLYEAAAVVPATGPLHDEVERIRASTREPKARAEAALTLVQDRVRYVALLMGQGSYVPTSAETTWSRRFGDCKAKTALLLAILHSLNIAAEPVLVNAQIGDAIADRLPLVTVFNHVLVRAHLGGKDYWLDGTRTGDTMLDELEVPNYGWGLPIVANAKLVSIVPPPLDLPTRERMVDVDATDGIFTPAKIQIHELYRSDSAIALNALYSQLTAAQRDEILRRTAKTYFDDVAVSSTSAQFDKQKRQFDIKIEGTTKLGWKDGWLFVPTSTIAFDADFNRPAGPLHDSPLAVDYPRFLKDVATIRLPAGFAATQKFDPPVNESVAGVEYRRSASVKGDTITVSSSERSLLREIPYKDALIAKDRLKKLYNDDVYLRLPEAYRMSGDDVKAKLSEAPTSASDYFQRGLLLLEAGKYDAAISDFTQSLKLKPNDEWALANRAIAFANLKNASSAAADLSAVERINPRNPVAARARGLLAETAGNFKAAIEAYSKSLETDPANNWALGRRAFARNSVGDKDGALIDSALALAKDPKWMDLRVLRANIYFVRGDRNAVAREAELVTKENPTSEFAFVAAGRIYARLNRKAEAMKAFDTALAIRPEGYVYLNRAQSRPFSDRAGRLADLEAALKLDPTDSDALAEKAEELAATGDLKAALAIYDRVTRDDPDDDLAIRRAILLYKTGRKAEAENLLATQRAKAKTASDFNRLCWNKATADILLLEALTDCQEALKIDPDNTGIMDSLALVLLRLGRIDEAILEYTRVLAKSPGAGSYMGRSLAYAMKGDLGRADADRTEALRLDADTETRFAEYGLKR